MDTAIDMPGSAQHLGHSGDDNQNGPFGFLALVLRQRHIDRWGLMRPLEPESVLEHSAVVTLLTLLAGSVAQLRQKPIDLSKALSYAILHDTAEVLISDVVAPIKNANAALREAFADLEQEAERKLIETLPPCLHPTFENLFATQCYECDLVKACDVYAAWLKAKNEVKAGNGVEFGQACNRLRANVDKSLDTFDELAAIDHWFSGGICRSVDELLSSGPEFLLSDL